MTVGPQIEHALERAAKTAYKMADQGLDDVRVTDLLGTLIREEVLAEAWRNSAHRSVVKCGLRPAKRID